jgi:hypothetical protein
MEPLRQNPSHITLDNLITRHHKGQIRLKREGESKSGIAAKKATMWP